MTNQSNSTQDTLADCPCGGRPVLGGNQIGERVISCSHRCGRAGAYGADMGEAMAKWNAANR